MNYSQITLDQLLDRVATLERIKIMRQPINYFELSQNGLDRANAELSAIEAELDTRKPGGDFVTLLGDDGLPVGFEPMLEFEAQWADAEYQRQQGQVDMFDRNGEEIPF